MSTLEDPPSFVPAPRNARWRWVVALGLGLVLNAAWAPQAGPLPDQPASETPPAAEPERTPWRYIVIHHSASPSGNAAVFSKLHRQKGWDGLAYHFVIDNGHGGPDGRLEVGSRWWQQKHGAHAGHLPPDDEQERNVYNEFGIGICLVGNFNHRAPTPAQMEMLARLVAKLRDQYNIPEDAIMGHRHVRSTACPGQYFPWGSLFATLGLPPPQHLFRHPDTGTLKRCQWCLLNEPPVESLPVGPQQPEQPDLPAPDAIRAPVPEAP